MSRKRLRYLAEKLELLRKDLQLERAAQATFQTHLQDSSKRVSALVERIMEIEKEIGDYHV